MFSIKKCDQLECEVCDFPRLPPSIFNDLHHLPDPTPDSDHFFSFDALYGTETTEIHRPSLKEVEGKSHGMSFSPTAQYAKNTMLTITCVECNKPRVCYSKKKLKDTERNKIVRMIEDLQYTCGTYFDSEDESPLILIEMRKNIICNSYIEVPYYGAQHKNICIHCSSDENLKEEVGCYPICSECHSIKKKIISRRGSCKMSE